MPANGSNGASSPIRFETDPTRYQHWKLSVAGAVARLELDVAEDGGIAPGYQLKLNSYDLGVDIELNDALNRIRYEHPGVRAVVVASARPRMFCSGANIYMLGLSSHGDKVNFCKFTNETRNGMEDSSAFEGIRFLAAINGACAGGGYELALACDEILMVDDRSSTVSLPEVPLLGVLPGTGGLTRLVDKRRVRRDLADVFCTTAEGVKAERAREWRLVDHIAKPAAFDEAVAEHAARLAADGLRPAGAAGVQLAALACTQDGPDRRSYSLVRCVIDRAQRSAAITLSGPDDAPPADGDAARAAGSEYWALRLAREFEDLVLHLRTNETEIGLWLLRTEGDLARTLAHDAFLEANQDHWFVRQVCGTWRRLLSRLDVGSRSMFALVEPGSCFGGVLLEVALAADRVYMLDTEETEPGAALSLVESNFGRYPMANGATRLAAHYAGLVPEDLREHLGAALGAAQCDALGLVTAAPDDLDYAEEVRIAIEERVAQSPDALTAMEANLRFPGAETMVTRIFGRLTAWQNWVFQRPNATGEAGALKVYGTGSRPDFDRRRV